MKKLIILLLTLTLILGVFASCGKKYINPLNDETSSSPSEATRAEITESNETNQTENTDTDDNLTETTTEATTETEVLEKDYKYTVEKIDGKYYVCFEDYEPISVTDQVGYTSLFVPSIDYLKNTVPSGNMDIAAKRHLMMCIDDNIDHKVQIFDVEHVWQPTLPSDWGVKSEVDWRVQYYVFTAIHEQNPYANVQCWVYPEDVYERSYNNVQQNYVSWEYTRSEFLDGNKEIVVFYQGSGSNHTDSDKSNQYFYYEIFATNGEYYGVFHVDSPNELSAEELMQFGFEEYLG